MKKFHGSKLKFFTALLAFAEITIIFIYIHEFRKFNKNFVFEKSEAAVVLFHSFDKNNYSKLSSITERRLRSALDIFHKSKVKKNYFCRRL